MKARIPRAYGSLPAKQRDAITEYARQVGFEAAKEQSNKDARIILDLYIKMVCVVLHGARL